MLQPVGDNVLDCPRNSGDEGGLSFCDGEIPPLTNIVRGDADGSCACADKKGISPRSKKLGSFDVETMHLDYNQHYNGSNIQISLNRDHQVKSINISNVNGQLIKRIDQIDNRQRFSIDIPKQRQIYVIQYIYEESMESALIPVL